jgi:hypothetical protein
VRVEKGGSTRLSFGAFTTEDEVLEAAAALRELSGERESSLAAAALSGSPS